jgi:TrmH family RNA methyltransferase
MEVLLSDKNPLLKQVRRAVQMGALTEDGFAVAEGFHLLAEATASGREIGAVIFSESARKTRVKNPLIRAVTVSDAIFNTMSSTETPQGVIALVKPLASTMKDVFSGCALVAVLDGIQDPGNAGAILRATEAFGATGAVFLKGSVYPYNPKCVRASAGSIFRLPVVTGFTPSALMEEAEASGAALYAAMPDAKVEASGADFKRSCAIVIGSEGRGVSGELAGRATAMRIPTAHVESLNAAVAAGILFYEARRQRNDA